MNERIKELAEQAGLKINYWKTNPTTPFLILADYEQFEKLTELIVEECIQQAHGVSDLRGVNDDMIYGADTAAVRIAKHFGVGSKPIIPIEIEPHTCPYKTELYGDETLCTCSPEQEHECAMDV